MKDILLQKSVHIKDFINCTKLYLSFEEWLHSTNPKVAVKQSRHVISQMVTLIQKCFPRTDNDGSEIGQGWKFPKMHALTKFVDYIICLAVPLTSLKVLVNATIRNLSRTQDVTHRREPTPSLVKLQLDIQRQ